MAYLVSNICTKNYWNRIVEIIVGGWVVSFFETQCSLHQWLLTKHWMSVDIVALM